jgi:hypothetical protein
MMIHLDAGHDVNGNPRRAFAQYGDSGMLQAAWNEGYHGTAAVPEAYRYEADHAPKIPTTPKFYRETLREAQRIDVLAAIAAAKARREVTA